MIAFQDFVPQQLQPAGFLTAVKSFNLRPQASHVRLLVYLPERPHNR